VGGVRKLGAMGVNRRMGRLDRDGVGVGGKWTDWKSTLGYLAALEFIAGVAFLGHNSNDLPTNRIGA